MKDLSIGVPILGITGINGAGKTLYGASVVCLRLRSGRRVLSTVPVTDPASGRSTEPILSLEQLLHERDITVFFDDVAAILPSGNLNLPHELNLLMHVFRHKGIDVIWTAPGWMRANNNLRLITQAQLAVQPLLRVVDSGTPWPRPRLIQVALFDTSNLKPDAVPVRRLRRAFVLPMRLPGWGSYDTLADTPVLIAQPTGGRRNCCGGTEKPKAHSPELHAALGIPWYGD